MVCDLCWERAWQMKATLGGSMAEHYAQAKDEHSSVPGHMTLAIGEQPLSNAADNSGKDVTPND